jgi:hypothetical protein
MYRDHVSSEGTLAALDDRRQAPRFELLDRLHGHIVSVAEPVRVREVSLGGLSFESSISFPVGAVHEFRLTLGDDSTVLLRGRVVRCLQHQLADGAARFVTGVQFLDDEPPDGEPTMSDLIRRIA